MTSSSSLQHSNNTINNMSIGDDGVVDDKMKKEDGGGRPPLRVRVVFVTGNANKLREVQAIMQESNNNNNNSGGGGDNNNSVQFDVVSRKIDVPELQGEQEQITRDKCLYAVQHLQKDAAGEDEDDNTPTVVVVEDTSLCFRALGGLPGPYIKWFLERLGHDGLNKLLAAYQDKTAHAACHIGYAWIDDGNSRTAAAEVEVRVVEGTVEGSIVPARAPPGAPVFGWDPVFEPHGEGGLTYAEMDPQRKNSMSHRARAFNALKEALQREALERAGRV